MVYTCPMHPQIEQDRPGSCPICGMALEPKTPIGTAEEENAELRDMARRFWIGAALALPIFVLGMAHLFPNALMWIASDWSRWLQFSLSTPVVLWAGAPFFQRGWQSVLNRSPNMFTLIAMGVGVAYIYSVVVMLAPGIFPPSFQERGKIGIYFEAASMITGEAMPVEKITGDRVTGGTINQTGSFLMTAEKVGTDTVLSRIVEMVAQAQRSRAPIQGLADEVASWFVPAVIAAAALTFIIWAMFGPEPRFAHAIVN